MVRIEAITILFGYNKVLFRLLVRRITMKLDLRKKVQVGIATMALLAGTTVLPASAYRGDNYYPGYARSDYYSNYYRGGTFSQRHPYVKKALIGGGIGAAAGALLSSEGRRTSGAVKGALVGGGIGLGYEYLRRQGTFSGRW